MEWVSFDVLHAFASIQYNDDERVFSIILSVCVGTHFQTASGKANVSAVRRKEGAVLDTLCFLICDGLEHVSGERSAR